MILQIQQNSCTFSTLIGAFFLFGLWKVAKMFYIILMPFFSKRLLLKKRYGGGWALVTGGSQGIGLSIAQQLAKQGFNLILMSRSIEKLTQAKNTILKQYNNIEVLIKSVDFSKIQTQQQYRNMLKQINNLDVSIVVNNVGFYVPQKFNQISFKNIRSQMKINLLPISFLSRIYLQKFQKRKDKSALINLSSAASIVNYKGACHYSASKSFDDYLSQTLQFQFRKKVDILTVRPFFVTSAMTNNTNSILHTNTGMTAKCAIDALGNQKISYGPLIHRIQGAFCQNMPDFISTAMSNKSVQDFLKDYHKQK